MGHLAHMQTLPLPTLVILVNFSVYNLLLSELVPDTVDLWQLPI